MHRKDFQAMADTIRAERDGIRRANIEPAGMRAALDSLRQCAETFATVAAQSNPRFGRRRFFEACGVTP